MNKDENKFSGIKIYKNKAIQKGFCLKIKEENKIGTKNNRRISADLNKVKRNKIYNETNNQVFPEKIFKIKRNSIIPYFNN